MIFRNVKTQFTLMLVLEQARGGEHSQRKIFGRTKYFDFQWAAVFCLGQHLWKHNM